MKPQMGQTSIILPITFDYSGGRRETKKSKILWSAIIGVVGLIIGIGVMINSDNFFLINIAIGGAVIYGVILFIRFAMLKESKVRIDYEDMQATDYQRETSDFWGIYTIEETYPYYCRFRNGKSGLFIRLNKDVILGKYSESEFEHYEAIGDAYNLAGAGKVQMCHIDYMDNVGTDERLEESFVSLESVSNPDVKDILSEVYTFQQEQMTNRVTTFDAYLFLWVGSDANAWATIQRIISCFLEANYRSYHILDASNIRDLAKVLMNIHDFSAIAAMSNSFENRAYSGITPIKIIHENGEETILNKTRAEKEEERLLLEREEELKKAELKKRKTKRRKTSSEDEEISFDIWE